ncbi:MAG: hypothetical protein ABR985_12035 [Methanotrichaceae archaeon]|jgi:hypothetical protein
MDIEELTRMDAEANRILESWADPSKGIENYPIMGDQLNGVYGGLLTPEQLAAFGSVVSVIDWGGRAYFLYVVGKEIKRVLDDRAAGKEAPTKEEFGKRFVSRSLSIKWSQDAPIDEAK